MVPVLNKIDLPSADPERVIAEIEDIIGIPAQGCGARQRQDRRGRAGHSRSGDCAHSRPRGQSGGAAQGADHRFLVRQLCRRGDAGARGRWRTQAQGPDTADVDADAAFMRAGRRVYARSRAPRAALSAGEVGFIIAGIKELKAAQVGDTVTHADRPAAEALPGIQGNQAAGVCRTLSGRCQSVRCAARCAGKTASERLIAALRAGIIAGARVSVFAAAFSACCTWISCRNAWSANTAWN